MPRDASGNYTLPAGNPVISGTVIESNWANSTMDDIAVALTDSLSRTGNGGMNVALTGVQGTAVNPSYSFVVDPLSGMYSGGTSDLRFSVASTDRMTITPTSIATTLPFFAQDGLVSVPAYTFASDPDTGWYLDTVSDLRISVAGTDRLLLSSSAITPRLPLTASDGLVSAPAYSFESDVDTGMYLDAVANLRFSVAGTDRMFLSTSAITTRSPIGALNGLVSAPAYSFESNLDTGMYLNAADDLRFSLGGVDLFLISPLVIQATAPFRQVNGTAGIPAYTFSSNSAYGMFFDGADNLGLTTGGIARLNITSTVIETALPMQAQNGSVSVPSYSFSNDTDTGMYLDFVGDLRFSVGGIARILASAVSVTTRVPLRTSLGSVSAPSLSFENDTDSGLYLFSAGDVRMSVASVDQMRWINNSTEVFDSAASAFFPVLHAGNSSAKNFIINGSMDLWQRGVSFSNVGYTADRWFNVTAATTVDRVTSPFGGSAFALRVQAGGGNNPVINYHVELDLQGVKPPFISNTDYTLSFDMSDSAAGADIRLTVDLVDNSAGANAVPIITGVNIGTTINGVQRIESTFNFGAPATAATNRALRLSIFLSTNGSVFILGRAKLEQSSRATLFGPVSKGEELIRAERYYEKSYQLTDDPGTVTASGRVVEQPTRNFSTLTHGEQYKTRKRVAATISIYSPVTGAINMIDNAGDKAASPGLPGETRFDSVSIAGGTTATGSAYQWTADAEI